MSADTIFALSSGSPPAGIAVVRISGPAAASALETLAGTLPRPRRARLAELRAAGGELLDTTLILWFPAPGSATGEDVAELHLHGGRAVVAAVLATLAQLPGLRAADAGEFTRRAFENGRLDLVEAEGLADLLAAETEGQRRSALALAAGGLSRDVEAWQGRLLALGAQLEALLDFSDEGEVASELPEAWRADLDRLLRDLGDRLERPPAERLKEGVRVVIAGPVNAGKSSMLNYLIQRDAAIISPIEGTTRDLVEAPTVIAGLPLLLVDTAGLRETGDQVETIGIARARGVLGSADIILWLGEPADCPDPERAIMVRTKADLPGNDRSGALSVSCVTGENMDALTSALLERVRALLPREGEVALHRRHRDALWETHAALRQAQGQDDPILIAESLRHARASLDRVTGRAGVEDMLDALFGRFCIGK